MAVFQGLIIFLNIKSHNYDNYGMVCDISKKEGNKVSLFLFLLFELDLLGC
jgi:hypothetical protein